VHWKACAIDGPGGGGKSTLAGQLATVLGATVVSMDSFLLPENKYRVSAIAKNYDLDRFFEEVIESLLDGRDINYRVMDLATGALEAQKINVPAGSPVIVEGVYSMELSFRDAYSFSIFVDAPKEELMNRAFSLEPGSRSWLDKWLEGEETYFAAQHPMLAATLVLDGTQTFPSTAQILEKIDISRSEG